MSIDEARLKLQRDLERYLNPNSTTDSLTTFKITYDDGNVTTTEMAAGVTLQMAQNHFIGHRFEITETTFRTAVKVEKID